MDVEQRRMTMTRLVISVLLWKELLENPWMKVRNEQDNVNVFGVEGRKNVGVVGVKVREYAMKMYHGRGMRLQVT